MTAINHFRLRLLLAGLAVSACISNASAAATQAGNGWVRGWASSPSFSSRETERTVRNQTIRQKVRVEIDGNSLRLQLSNEHGRSPLIIGAVSIAERGQSGFKAYPVNFGGGRSIAIPAGAPFISDPIPLKVKARQVLEVSIYLPEPTLLSTMHFNPKNEAIVSKAGDYTAAPEVPAEYTIAQQPFVSAVDVAPTIPAKSIVALGDSITDWDCVYSEADCRWNDVLSRRLQAAGKRYVVVNAGISGNRVMSDGAGLNALARFDRDVLSVPNVSYVILLEGINDIGASGPNIDPSKDGPVISPETIIAGYKQIIARAHAHGLKIYGAELLPFGGAAYASPEKEGVRLKVNEWIRTSGTFDGVIDFSASVADPANSTKLKLSLQLGDNLHPNAAGEKAMGEAIDLRLFE